MLNLIWYGNHPNLTYRGGQQPIIHLEADLHKVVQWADANACRWAFSLTNARATYTTFRTGLDQLSEVNWDAVAARDFRPPDIKEAKQAEFLVQEWFPWHLVERIGVYSQDIARRVASAMQGVMHRSRIEVKSDWYY